MIVVDASAAVAGLLHDGAARRTMETEQLHSLHLVDSEVAHVLRRLVANRSLSAPGGHVLITTWQGIAVTRYGAHGLLERIWQLRANLTAYDAGYVALAESLSCALLTADSRLAGAAGVRCPVTVVGR